MSETDLKYSWQSRDYDILNFTTKEPFSFNKSRTLPRLDVKKPERKENVRTITSNIRLHESKPSLQEEVLGKNLEKVLNETKAIHEGELKSKLDETNSRKAYKYSLMNISGYNYDFLNNCHRDNKWNIKKARVMGEDQFAIRKKGIGCYYDSGRITSINPNNAYLKTWKDNPNAFRRKKELCADFCQIAKGYGQKKTFRKMK